MIITIIVDETNEKATFVIRSCTSIDYDH